MLIVVTGMWLTSQLMTAITVVRKLLNKKHRQRCWCAKTETFYFLTEEDRTDDVLDSM